MQNRTKEISGMQMSVQQRNPDIFSKSKFKEPLGELPSINIVQRSSFNTNNLVSTNESQLIAQDNPSRSYFLIQNQGIGSVFVNFGQQADNGRGLEISAGGFYEPLSIPVSSIYIWSATQVPIFFAEGVPLR